MAFSSWLRAAFLLSPLLTGVSMPKKNHPGPPSADAMTTFTTFTVAMPHPETHLFEIGMSLARSPDPAASFDLVLPVWAPGSYAVRDFARNLRDLEVRDSRGKTVSVEKVEKSRWRVQPARSDAGPFSVKYRVYANELTVRTSHLDSSHGYGNGSSLFFYVDGRKNEPQGIRFDLPKKWKVSIALPEVNGVYRAAGYDELADSPFECGTHRTFDFSVRGKPHTLALWGSGNEEPQRLVTDLTKIVEAGADLFGALPYDRYLFIVHITANGGGGLEHRASQTDGISTWRFKPEKSYREVLSLFSHEFFHCWNVKRIHPAVLGPFDYTREVYTRDLWAMEGVTSYYEGVQLVRAGLIQPKHLFESWAKEIKSHRENPGSAVESAELSSFDAWIRFYKPDENSPNVSESYYRRGALIGLALDLMIRKESAGRRSLDDVLVSLYREYGARDVGYPEGAYEGTVAKTLGDRAEEARRFFDQYVRAASTPPFESILTSAGLVMTEKGEKDEDDKESDDKSKDPPVKNRSEFGWKTKTENGRLVVSEVYAGRPAYAAGISAADEIVALDQVKADDDQIKRIERDVPSGTSINISFFRRGRLMELPLSLGIHRVFTYQIKPDEHASPEARAFFVSWLKQPFPEKEKEKEKEKSAPEPGGKLE